MSRVPEDYDQLCDEAFYEYKSAIKSWWPNMISFSRPTRIYVAGPMRGIRYFNYPAFCGAKGALENFGYQVLMADLTEEPNEEGHTDTPLKKFMQHDLPLLCQADCVFVLPGWQNSHGAKVEVHLAFQLDIPVYDILTGRDIVEVAKEKAEYVLVTNREAEALTGEAKESCKHLDNHFDRSICACGNMHTYCNDCGDVLDDCPYEKKEERAEALTDWHVDTIKDALKPKRHPKSERVHEVLREAGELHDMKQSDYGSDGDPFKNVRNSEDFGVPAWIGCAIRLNDKVKRLQTLATKGSLSNESAIDSFMDIIVYGAIGLVLFEETI